MKIMKVFNNNVLLVKDSEEVEAVIMGRGIGFKKKKGDTLVGVDIEKTYLLKEMKEIKQLESLLEKIPMKYIMLSHKIIDYAKEKINLNNYIYFTLTDHIYHTIRFYKQGLKRPINPLVNEIKRTYSDEYKIALKAVEMIKEETGIELKEEESANIALHFLNAEINKKHDEINSLSELVKQIKEILEIITYTLGIKLDEKNHSYKRFINHLKICIKNLDKKEVELSLADKNLLEILKKRYANSFDCMEKITLYLGKELELEDQIELVTHIERIKKLHK